METKLLKAKEFTQKKLRERYKLTAEELERKYLEQTVRDLASELGIVPATLFRYLKILGIEKKGRVMKINVIQNDNQACHKDT